MSGVPAAGVQPSQGVTTDGEPGEKKKSNKRKVISFFAPFSHLLKNPGEKVDKVLWRRAASAPTLPQGDQTFYKIQL